MDSPANRVMLVDDAALMRDAVAAIVATDPSFEVVASCDNGQIALWQLGYTEPDVIVVDLEMPVMDGLTFLRRVRPRTRAKVVVLSSRVDLGCDQAVEARRLGADAVIQKPSGSVSTDLAARRGEQMMATLRTLVA